MSSSPRLLSPRLRNQLIGPSRGLTWAQLKESLESERGGKIQENGKSATIPDSYKHDGFRPSQTGILYGDG
jgi:hypothetical protein